MLPVLQLSKAARGFIAIAAFFGGSAVMLGAYASHGLSTWATSAQVSQVELAVYYQLFHTIILLITTILCELLSQQGVVKRILHCSLWCFSLGIICFSGSLYYLVFIGSKLLVLLTPFGGILLIMAWLCLGIAVLFKQNKGCSLKS